MDDDEPLRRALQRLLRSAGYKAVTYGTAAAIIEAAPRLSGCLFLDLRMPDMDGLEVQAQLAERGVHLPVIVVTGHGDFATAVRAMKAGALDFIEKPIEEDRLLAAVEAAVWEGTHNSRDAESAGAAQQMASLSPRERLVLEAIVVGKANKVIAYDLDIRIRTGSTPWASCQRRPPTRSINRSVYRR